MKCPGCGEEFNVLDGHARTRPGCFVVTVLGPPVNHAARWKALARKLHEDIGRQEKASCDYIDALYAERDALKAHIDRLHELHWERLQALEAQVDRLRGALRRYGAHGNRCDWHRMCTVADDSNPRFPCTCGLDAALGKES